MSFVFQMQNTVAGSIIFNYIKLQNIVHSIVLYHAKGMAGCRSSRILKVRVHSPGLFGSVCKVQNVTYGAEICVIGSITLTYATLCINWFVFLYITLKIWKVVNVNVAGF